jgi:hypothetical protein
MSFVRKNLEKHLLMKIVYRCSFKFIFEVGVDESHHGLQISCLNLTSLFALFVFLVCRLTSGAFTIDSLTPTLKIHLNEHLICSN